MITTFRTSIHGRSIDLPGSLTLPEGRLVEVTIKTCPEAEIARESLVPPVETWCDRIVFDAAVSETEKVVKGTRLLAEALVAELQQGKSDEGMLVAHSELSRGNVAALRNYARWPVGLRQAFGAWAGEAEEVDRYLEWTRQNRQLCPDSRRPLAEITSTSDAQRRPQSKPCQLLQHSDRCL